MPCAIVFHADERKTLILGVDADDAGKRLSSAQGFERFEDSRGRTYWINPANVLYVEDRGTDRPRAQVM